ncbi:hypothetical protein A6A06_23875 [Streptomyces sp. CB02923]|uniref:hypothetical protein n=1 Tax=Streptomyces sp. CB02923 TaxID=1718985 RepID=UPI00093A2E95|nr:hypothetical protein [Streptomyces sp. CB02923]OKI00200.1 hypothetical protein A6A06_23875 [Streptomyces sp. CB02923]
MTDRDRPKPRITRGGVLLTLTAVTACGLMLFGALQLKQAQIAWSLTYEATSTGGPPHADGVRYRHTPGDGQSEERLGGTRLPWRKSVTVGGGEEARVEVRPAGDGTASCRILLDGERQVAAGRSPGPGKPAVCRVTASDTSQKWP